MQHEKEYPLWSMTVETSLRDQIAFEAFKIYADHYRGGLRDQERADYIAKESYMMADAMMAEREKKKEAKNE